MSSHEQIWKSTANIEYKLLLFHRLGLAYLLSLSLIEQMKIVRHSVLLLSVMYYIIMQTGVLPNFEPAQYIFQGG